MEKKSATLLFSLAAIFLTAVEVLSISPNGVQKMKIVDMKVGDKNVPIMDNKGHASNCGKVPFNMTWTPKVLKSSGEVKVHLEYTSPHDLSSGFVNASVFFYGDSEPFLGYSSGFTCDKVKEYFPCPVKKGDRVNKTEIISNIRAISSYLGEYVAVLKVQNQDRQEMVCVNLTVTVSE
ncbi:uncharacterized protein LOC101856886 [Aplysia californica]|uniref:Uncharacterized protein LOC101856886 n=1 Tax=Aplysia californica TaxID=6500 RepID=A0ABM0JLY4_APLCA|nr:uncharacterized protein LOC101856886 [Aplysia californica]